MRKLKSPSGTTVSYDKVGNGQPLVLVHGSFSDHRSSWEFVTPLFAGPSAEDRQEIAGTPILPKNR
jgi:hypothetical protein